MSSVAISKTYGPESASVLAWDVDKSGDKPSGINVNIHYGAPGKNKFIEARIPDEAIIDYITRNFDVNVRLTEKSDS